MTSKVSRAALIASLAIGASGLVAVPAEAANGVATANYYVNGPSIGSAGTITPESAVVQGSVDTGGSTETFLPIPSGGLMWQNAATIAAGVKWAANTTGNYVPVDGLPASGSNSNVSVIVTDSGDTAISGVPTDISNAGANNYSDVTFEYDPVADYVANGDEPGPLTEFAQDVQVATVPGISGVRATIGAFGLNAQNNTGNAPLSSNTKYYFWLVQQAGATDAATDINIAQWASQTANPTYKCYPNAAIAQDPTLASYTSTTPINYDGTTATALQGPCVYYYGDTSGALYYQSPNGEFKTPKLGNLTIGHSAVVAGNKAKLEIADKSDFKASGTVQLTTKGGKVLGSGKFGLQPGKSGFLALKLTGAGVKAAARHQKATVALTSNWDQPSSTKSVAL